MGFPNPIMFESGYLPRTDRAGLSRMRFLSRTTNAVRGGGIAAVCLAVPFGQALAQPSPTQTVVRVGVHDAWPLVFKDDDGVLRGFAVDVLQHIATERDWNLQFVSGVMTEMVKKQKADVLFPTPRRDFKSLEVVEPAFCLAWGGVFSRNPSRHRSIIDLGNSTVAVLPNDWFGNQFREMIKELGVPIKVVEAKNSEAAFRLVADGKAQAAAVEAIDGARRADRWGLEMTPIRYGHVTGHFAVSRDRPGIAAALSEDLARLKADPQSVYHRSYDHWYAPMLRPPLPRWVLPSLYVGLGALLFLVGSLILSRWRYRKLQGQATDLSTGIRREKAKLAALHEDFQAQITSLKSAGDRLRQSQKLEVLGQLTGGVAHDFNNLLGIILGNLELVKDELGGSDEVASCIDDAIGATTRGGQLTHRLLAFARRQPLQPATVDVAKLLNGWRDLLPRALGEQIGIEIRHDEGLWDTTADPAQLESAVLNLVLNARDAMPKGGNLVVTARNVRVGPAQAAEAETDPGRYVELAVADTGKGFSPEAMGKAFDPFYTTKPVGEGSGLGLSMVYGFAKQSGGHVMIESEPGRGATVRMLLPRSETDGEEGGPAAPPLDEAASGRGETVLLIEDDPNLRKLVTAMLTGLGYDCVAVADGAEATTAAANMGRIDALIADVVLPGEHNGKEVAEALCAQRPGLPVLFMSGYTENAMIREGRIEPGVRLIQKPFRRNDLAKALRATLESGST